MTIDEIASFCEFKDCNVLAGDPERGYVGISGRGIDRDTYTWGRFNMFGEAGNPPAPEQILREATLFLIQRGESKRELNREEFAGELERFQKLVGI